MQITSHEDMSNLYYMIFLRFVLLYNENEKLMHEFILNGAISFLNCLDMNVSLLSQWYFRVRIYFYQNFF